MNYCIDTNTLIHSWRFWYAQQTHPTLWDAFADLGRSGTLKMPEQVLQELGEREDSLYEWCKARKNVLVYEATDETEEAYRDLVNQYPDMVGRLGMGSNYADLYVVAVAMVEGATVVTDEDHGFKFDPNRRRRSRKNFKVTNVCLEHDIPLIRAYDVLRKEGWVFTH